MGVKNYKKSCGGKLSWKEKKIEKVLKGKTFVFVRKSTKLNRCKKTFLKEKLYERLEL